MGRVRKTRDCAAGNFIVLFPRPSIEVYIWYNIGKTRVPQKEGTGLGKRSLYERPGSMHPHARRLNDLKKNEFIRAVRCMHPYFRLLRRVRGELFHLRSFLERLLLGIPYRSYREEAGHHHWIALDGDVLSSLRFVRHVHYGPHVKVRLFVSGTLYLHSYVILWLLCRYDDGYVVGSMQLPTHAAGSPHTTPDNHLP